MPRLLKRHFKQRVDITPVAEEGPLGDTLGETRVDEPAHVEQKLFTVVDQRQSSDTRGQEVKGSTMVILLPTYENVNLRAETEVTVWKQYPGRKRTSQVVASEFKQYDDRTPNHVVLYLE